MVQVLGQPATGWTKAESLLGGGKAPLSENTKAVWSRQDRAKKAADGERSSLLATYGDISRFSVTSTPQPGPPPRANFIWLGHDCLSYPKFHCGLNYIEFFWGAVKWYTRENCNYSFAELEPTVLAGLESVSLCTIQRFANRSRWIDSYIFGLNDKQKGFVEWQEKSHRRDMGKRL